MNDDPDEIPLFPLPGVTLFPLATVPLFVFELRYRQMLTDVIEHTTRRIGLIAVAEAHLGDMEGNPPVARIGCEGEVVGAEQNPDGTFRVLVRGTRRFRILDERLPEAPRLYRIARIETAPDAIEAGDDEILRARRGEVLALCTDLVRRTVPEHADSFRADQFDDVGDEQLVNTLAQAIDLAAHDKQQLLELDRVCERQRMLCELMRFRIAEIEGGSGAGPSTLQ